MIILQTTADCAVPARPSNSVSFTLQQFFPEKSVCGRERILQCFNIGTFVYPFDKKFLYTIYFKRGN